MKLKTEIVPLLVENRSHILDEVVAYLESRTSSAEAVLRWGLLNIDGPNVLLEVATIIGAPAQGYDFRANDALTDLANTLDQAQAGVHIAIVVPTGVGASIGGFIGDASPVSRALEAVADTVILHPNVVNAADFYGGGPRSLYVDGLTLDRFFGGQLRLGMPHQNRIGLLLDRLDPKLEALLLNAANGVRAVNGVEMVGYTVCAEKVKVYVSRSAYGHFIGTVENPDVLFRAAEALREQGATAIAAVTAIEGVGEEDLAAHYAGLIPNPVGSVEALISRAITWRTGLACAHAPAFIEGLGESLAVIDPRAAAEVASGTGLPCVLNGLARTPPALTAGGIGASDLSAIIIPFECAGGPPALSAQRFGIPLLAVKSNHCTVGALVDQLDIPTAIAVENYAEAIAFVACARAGVSWQSLQRPIAPLKELRQ